MSFLTIIQFVMAAALFLYNTEYVSMRTSSGIDLGVYIVMITVDVIFSILMLHYGVGVVLAVCLVLRMILFSAMKWISDRDDLRIIFIINIGLSVTSVIAAHLAI